MLFIMPENALEVVSEHLKIKIFLGEHAPRPPYVCTCITRNYSKISQESPMIIVHAQLRSHVLVIMLKAFTRRSPYFCKKNPPHKNPGNGPESGPLPVAGGGGFVRTFRTPPGYGHVHSYSSSLLKLSMLSPHLKRFSVWLSTHSTMSQEEQRELRG